MLFRSAARLLLSALIGFLAAEAPMDEQSFPMVMELLNCMEGEKEDGCQDAVESLLEDAVRNTHRHEEYYSNYQRYQLMQVDKTRVILACRITVSYTHLCHVDIVRLSLRPFFVKKTVHRIGFRSILQQGCHDLKQCLAQPCGADL